MKGRVHGAGAGVHADVHAGVQGRCECGCARGCACGCGGQGRPTLPAPGPFSWNKGRVQVCMRVCRASVHAGMHAGAAAGHLAAAGTLQLELAVHHHHRLLELVDLRGGDDRCDGPVWTGRRGKRARAHERVGRPRGGVRGQVRMGGSKTTGVKGRVSEWAVAESTYAAVTRANSLFMEVGTIV